MVSARRRPAASRPLASRKPTLVSITPVSAPPVRRTFVDDERQEQFERDGFVVMPFLTDDDVAFFTQMVEELYANPQDYFYKSAENFFTSAQNRPADPNFGRVHELVVERFRDRVAAQFDRYEIRHGYVMTKPPHSTVGVPVHQDEAFLDESQSRGVLIWCPLVDTNAENGWLNVLVGSHTVLPLDRPTGHAPWPFREVEERLYHHLTPLEVKAGDVVAYDGALIHASPPNRSSVLRPTVGIGLAPEEAQLICDFWVEDEDRVDRYYVRPEFYVRHELGVQPTSMYDRVEPRDWAPPVVTDADLDRWYGPDPGEPPGFQPFMPREWERGNREEFVAPPDDDPSASASEDEDTGAASAEEAHRTEAAPPPASAARRARRLAGKVKRRLIGPSTPS